jgi:hypothetical protein
LVLTNFLVGILRLEAAPHTLCHFLFLVFMLTEERKGGGSWEDGECEGTRDAKKEGGGDALASVELDGRRGKWQSGVHSGGQVGEIMIDGSSGYFAQSKESTRGPPELVQHFCLFRL